MHVNAASSLLTCVPLGTLFQSPSRAHTVLSLFPPPGSSALPLPWGVLSRCLGHRTSPCVLGLGRRAQLRRCWCLCLCPSVAGQVRHQKHKEERWLSREATQTPEPPPAEAPLRASWGLAQRGGLAGAEAGGDSSLTSLPVPCLTEADPLLRTSAGWKVWRPLSCSLPGLSVPICKGVVLSGDTPGGGGGGSGAARRIAWELRHLPQASPGMCQLQD